jgi:hypothetical protein
MTIFCFYLKNRLIQTRRTGGQWYSDTSPFNIPWKYNKGRFKHDKLARFQLKITAAAKFVSLPEVSRRRFRPFHRETSSPRLPSLLKLKVEQNLSEIGALLSLGVPEPWDKIT